MSDKRVTKKWTKRGIDQMLALLPIMEERGFEIATWPDQEPEAVDGMVVHYIPYPEYHPVVDRFWDLCYNTSCFTPPYASLPEDPPGMEDNPQMILTTERSMETATLAQLRRYFVLCTRGERFCTGYIDGQFRDGLFMAALRRLRELREEME